MLSVRYYFVDYENVDVAGFEGMSELCETDAVYLPAAADAAVAVPGDGFCGGGD